MPFRLRQLVGRYRSRLRFAPAWQARRLQLFLVRHSFSDDGSIFVFPISAFIASAMTRPTSTLRLLLISAFQLFSISAFTAAAADLGQLQASFMARYDEANATRDESLKKLEASYLGALKRHMDKVKASGKLELVVPVRDEIEAVESKVDPLPVLPENTSYDLKQLRKKYENARREVATDHAEAILELSEKMTSALEKQEAELTKAGEIDEALAAKRMRETLDKDVGIKAARAVIDANEDGWAGREWRSLLKLPFKRVDPPGPFYGGMLSSIPEGARIYQPLVDRISEQREKPENILFAMAPAIWEFRAESEVRKIRGKLMLGHAGGDATFRILAGKKEVFSKRLDEEAEVHFSAEFPPTRRITLEFDHHLNPTFDWCAWLNPEVR